jgi:hypothetical protein
MSAQALPWRDRMVAVDHELHVALIILAGAADHQYVPEADWGRLTLCLHRLRALSGAQA